MTAQDGALANVRAAAALLGRPVTALESPAGGQHAVTTVVSDGVEDYVVRSFPPGDTAVAREVVVLPGLAQLGGLAPHLIAADAAAARPLIVTDRLPGTAPDPQLAPTSLATGLAGALARIHALDGAGLPSRPSPPPSGETVLARRTEQDWPRLTAAPRMLCHGDFWCGNALWRGDVLTGVVDWCGAGRAPRGMDVAWCRLDLVLLGSHRAAEQFARAYERAAGVTLEDIAAWDGWAVVHADPNVESWSVNYAGIGRTSLTGAELRRRFQAWTQHLLHDL